MHECREFYGSLFWRLYITAKGSAFCTFTRVSTYFFKSNQHSTIIIKNITTKIPTNLGSSRVSIDFCAILNQNKIIFHLCQISISSSVIELIDEFYLIMSFDYIWFPREIS